MTAFVLEVLERLTKYFRIYTLYISSVESEIPLILKRGKIYVYVYPKDHGRPHVHIYQGSGRNPEASAKIEIGSGVVLSNSSFSKKDIRAIIEWLDEYKEELLDSWKEYND